MIENSEVFRNFEFGLFNIDTNKIDIKENSHSSRISINEREIFLSLKFLYFVRQFFGKYFFRKF